MNHPTNQPVTPALTRLLGPEEPELTCEECFAQLDVYVERELEGSDADRAVPAMRAHLVGCPACHEEYLSLRALAVDSDQRPHRRSA